MFLFGKDNTSQQGEYINVNKTMTVEHILLCMAGKTVQFSVANSADSTAEGTEFDVSEQFLLYKGDSHVTVETADMEPYRLLPQLSDDHFEGVSPKDGMHAPAPYRFDVQKDGVRLTVTVDRHKQAASVNGQELTDSWMMIDRGSHITIGPLEVTIGTEQES